MNISVQINVINRVNGPGTSSRWPKCVLVSKQTRNIWILYFGKITTTTKTITTEKRNFNQTINVKKWLVKWLKARRTEEDDVNDGRGVHHGGREEPGNLCQVRLTVYIIVSLKVSLKQVLIRGKPQE